MNKTIWIVVAAVISLTAGLMARNGWSPLIKSKQPLPAFSLPDLSGKQHPISEWQGKILIINFWATWCPPCKKEIPTFIAMQAQYGVQGLQFVGVAIEDKKPVAEYLSSVNINYPVLIGGDEGTALSHKLGNLFDVVPYSLVVDANGQIIHLHPGEFSKQQILDIIKPLLRNTETGPD